MSKREPYRLRPLVEALPATVPFVGPEAQERNSGRKFSARIGANENLFGVSPKAAAAMAEAGKEIWKYCDPEGHDLRRALATYHGIGMTISCSPTASTGCSASPRGCSSSRASMS